MSVGAKNVNGATRERSESWGVENVNLDGTTCVELAKHTYVSESVYEGVMNVIREARIM